MNPLRDVPGHPHEVGPQLAPGHRINLGNAGEKAAVEKMLDLVMQGVVSIEVVAVADEGEKQRLIVLRETYQA